MDGHAMAQTAAEVGLWSRGGSVSTGLELELRPAVDADDPTDDDAALLPNSSGATLAACLRNMLPACFRPPPLLRERAQAGKAPEPCTSKYATQSRSREPPPLLLLLITGAVRVKQKATFGRPSPVWGTKLRAFPVVRGTLRLARSVARQHGR